MNAGFMSVRRLQIGNVRTASTIEHLCIVATPMPQSGLLTDVNIPSDFDSGRLFENRAVSQMISYSVEA